MVHYIFITLCIGKFNMITLTFNYKWNWLILYIVYIFNGPVLYNIVFIYGGRRQRYYDLYEQEG